VEKACITLGIGQEGVRAVAHDPDYRMDTAALAAAIEDDRRSGWRPCAVVATLGTTSSGSMDPVAQIAEIAARESLWLHVDAAYAGPAAILPEKRPLFAGWERADSIVLNPHKWLFTPFDFSAFYTRDPQTLRAAFSLVPPVYLTTKEGDQVHNFMDYGIQLGRRFRALKLWFVLRYFGQEGVRRALRHHIELAQTFAGWVDADPDWERMAAAHFSLVCFRYRPPGASEARLDELNAALIEAANASGRTFLSQTRLNGQLTIRLAIGHLRTSIADLREVWELLRAEARRTSP
jgi:aromatic-L-amino-acid decarboxylase